MTKTRTRIRWGTPFYVCANGLWWNAPSGVDWQTSLATEFDGNWTHQGDRTPNTNLIFDPIANIYRRGAETFQLLDVQGDPTHTILRLVQFWVDEIPEAYYWRSVVTIEGTNGSVISQTFLNSQGGWLVSVDLFFTRKGAAGDVVVSICEVVNGAPAFERVIARTTIPVASLAIYPTATKATFLPTYLGKGKRYAIVLQTSGNHFVALVNNNKFAQGSLFYSTDGAWTMGDLQKDLTFRLNFAKFAATRVAVPLLGVELTGGIAGIDINYDSIKPPGSGITFEVQVAGVWVPMGYYAANPLVALPPLLPFRAVFSGTTDEMPGMGVAANSRILTFRPRSDFRHISTARIMPTPVSTVYLDFRLGAWRGPPYHVFTPRLLTGAGYATVRTPSLIEDSEAPEDPTVLIRRCTFNLAALGGAPISGYKVRMEGTTDNVVTCYHVEERVDVGV